jgi:hypothetical protein
MNFILSLLLLIGPWAVSLADSDIVVRSTVRPLEAWVGQRVVLQMDVLSESGWAQVSHFGEIQLDDAYVVRGEEQGVRLQETIDGRGYTGQRYEFGIYPQREGAVSLGTIPLEVMVKRWGVSATTRPRTVNTAPITIKVQRPPGSEAVQGLISTKRLRARQRWAPASESLALGDALKRTVTFEAEDVSGMAFSPLRHSKLPGVGTYPAQPLVEDRKNRGALTGRRVQSVAYMFERPGVVTIPDVRLTWWNLADEQLETVVLPGKTLEIASGTVEKSDSSSAVGDRRGDFVMAWWLVAICLAMGLVTIRFRRRLLERWQEWRAERAESEVNYYRRALASVRSRDARSALRDIMRWLDRINDENVPAMLRAYASRYTLAGPRERDAMDQLECAVVSNKRLAQPAHLIALLRSIRSGWRRTKGTGSANRAVLPGLNG